MMVGMMLVRPVQTLFGYKEGEGGEGDVGMGDVSLARVCLFETRIL